MQENCLYKNSLDKRTKDKSVPSFLSLLMALLFLGGPVFVKQR